MQQEALELCLTEDTPHSCLLWTVHQHLLPNAGLQWEVTHLIVISQSMEANKYCVSSGWSPLGQNWLSVWCCLCQGEGCMASCFRNKKVLQQACEHLSQGIFCKALPSSCRG